MKIRIVVCALLAALICAAGSSAFGAEQWPMFRHDNTRTGLAVKDPATGGPGVLGTFRPTPTWVFPAPETSTYTVDNGDAAFLKTGTWNNTPLDGIAPYVVEGVDPYLWTPTAVSESATAKWTFTFAGPAYTMRGTSAKFTVFIWVASPGPGETPPHCEDAHYTVLINGVVIGNYTLDQSSGGGWQYLPGSPSLNVNKADIVVVRLSNKTELKDESDVLIPSQVLADAVMLKTDAGMVFASPAASTTQPLVVSASTEAANVLRGGTFGNATVGAVYGIGAEPISGIAASTDNRGFMKWRFPAADRDWIAGGISSSPTLTTVLGTEKAVVAGVDGTVYVMDIGGPDQTPPVLQWKGPGYFVEPVAASWTPVTVAGVRGADCLTTNSEKAATPSSPSTTATWTFAPAAGYYDVYAWIPPSGNDIFVGDARYTEKKSDPKDDITTQVYQGGGGFWALVRKGIKATGANVVIKLSNETDGEILSKSKPVKVVADDMKLVPAGVESFDFSSPAVDSSGNIYIGSAGSVGRVMKLNTSQQNPVWTFPATSEQPIGSVNASPAIGVDGTIYVGSTDGHIYAIKPDGTKKWVYPDPDGAAGTTLALPEISSTTAVTTFSGTTIYFSTGAAGGGVSADLEGRVYALDDTGKPKWIYPSIGPPIVDGLGAFVYSSPLIMKSVFSDGKPQVVVGSTDASLYSIDAGDCTVPTTLSKSTRLSGLIMSSPAGTYVNFPDYVNRATGVPRATVAPMAFVGSSSRIYGVDLNATSTAPKDWWWDLLGDTVSSPAVTKNRIYIGDTSGYTWAFSTGLIGGGAENWNTELGAYPPGAGSDHGAGGRDAKPEVDIFTKEKWDNTLKPLLEASERSDGHGNSQDWFSGSTFRSYARDNGAVRPDQYQMEWGEDMVIVVWNLLDPNRKGDPVTWKRRYTSGDGTQAKNPAWEDDYHGRVEILMKSHAPGAASGAEEKIPVSEIDNFMDKDDDPSAVIDTPGPKPGGRNGYSGFYAVGEYTLDGSSSAKSQTPGSMFTITAREVPTSPNASSMDIPVPHNLTGATSDLNPPQEFAINNPLGVVYSGPYGTTTSTANIGMESDGLTTNRDSSGAQENGNSTTPVIWGGYTPHNKLSDTRQINIMDRSLLSTTGSRIRKFRVERHDMRWTGYTGQVINPLPWEMSPSNTAANMPNASEDYPDIDLRQIRVRLLSNGNDPSQSSVDLRAGSTQPGVAIPLSWPAGLNPVNFAVQVPQFQPPNLPLVPLGTSPTPLQMENSGYTSYVYAYIDSNGNGMMDRPAGLGIGQLMSSAVTGTKAEAFRMLEVQVYVPADYRAQIEQQRVSIGEVPQGFGYTANGGVPQIFEPNLVPQSYAGQTILAPFGFGEWFKPLTIRNIGNVNLVKVGMLRTDLVSDTVQQPVIIGDGSGAVIPGSGYSIPAYGTANPCLVSTVDDNDYLNGTGFMTSEPPAMLSALRLPSRTFHKARVGESAPELRLPDYTSWAPAIPRVPQVPAISVAVPLGTPVGTYYGKVQLSEQGNAVSNLVDVVVTCNESRITGGNTLPGSPHLPHLDPQSMPGMAGVSGTPAAFRNPVTGNVMFFWSSSRYPDITVNSTVPPTSTDPAYLYLSKLEAQANGEFALSSVTNTITNEKQWWSPTLPPSSVFPSPSNIADFFPSPPTTGVVTPDLAIGAPGVPMKSSVKFGSPTVAVDKVNGKSYLLFTGQATKMDPTSVNGVRNTQEFRTYYAEINGETVVEGDVYSTSPNKTAQQIHGDWATPKFGVRGGIMIRAAGETPELWNFWYGGGSGKWRIYYNSKDNPSTPPDPANVLTQWTNEALLPIPKGLSSVAEPSPIFHTWAGATGNQFMVTYSAMSVFHKNSDIYMSRYQADSVRKTLKQGNYKQVQLQVMHQRAKLIPEVNDPATSSPLLGEKLTRDAATSVWYSKDVDWLADVASTVDVTPTKPLDFAVYVKLDPTDATSVYQINIGETNRDPSTGAIAYTFDGPSAAEVALKAKFRAVVINPTDGTVKFMKAPGGKALVVASYFPRAYRLTTDGAADSAPCAVMDDDPNPRFSTSTDGLPFYLPGGSGGLTPPPTDRLWVFWRRPSMEKSGTGIYYKAQRYMVQLDSQMGLNVETKTIGGRNVEVFTPAVTAVTGVNSAVTQPVEIDWVKNRLYFTGTDGKDFLQHGVDANDDPILVPYPKLVSVTYVDSTQTTHTDKKYYVQYVDEDISQSGKTFGNLTSLMVNEGQVNVFKDPGKIVSGLLIPSNRLWVFWTSTRSGNSDIYYETISPRFVGREYR